MNDQFRHLLRQERQLRGWSQEELAEKLPTTRVTISRWESGKTSPLPYWRRKICELFNKQIEELFPEIFSSSDTGDLAVDHIVSSETGEDDLQTDEISQNTQNQGSRQEAESVTQQLSREMAHFEIQGKRLELQKKFVECTIEIAKKMIVDVIDPECDAKTREYAIQVLLSKHQYTTEANDRELLPPTIDDVRNALEVAKQVTRYAENDEGSHDTSVEDDVSSTREKGEPWLNDRRGHGHVLVATLGAQPQIVTFTLDLLLASGYPISEVFVLHPRAVAQSRLRQSLLHLSAEFASSAYRTTQSTIHFRSHLLELHGKPIDDIVDDEHTDGALNTIRRLINQLKRQGYRIHLSISGGRNLIALLALEAAIFMFDRHDHIWDIYIPEALQLEAKEGAIMHAPPHAGVTLLQGPFIALGAYIYSPMDSFRSAQQEQQLQMEAQERALCAEVVGKATPAQLKVLQAFARGLRPQQVAEALAIAPATVNTHKSVLLSFCHNIWNIPQEERLDYHYLHAKFGDYFRQNDE